MNSCILQASVSVKRVGNFLKTSELDPGTVQWHPEAATGTYEFLCVDLLLCALALNIQSVCTNSVFTVYLLSQAMSFQYQWLMEPSHGMRLRGQLSPSIRQTVLCNLFI